MAKAEAALGNLATGVGVLAPVFVVFFVFNKLDFPPQIQPPILVHDALTALISAVIWYAVRRGAIHSRWAEALIAVSAMLVLSNTVLAEYLTRNAFYTTGTAIVIIALGMFFFSYRWLLAVIGASALFWVPLTRSIVATDKLFVDQCFVYGVASLVALAVLHRRLKTWDRISALHRQAADRQRELASALAATERELSERRRARDERRDVEAQLRQAQKLDAIGTLAGGVAHDMNNVLTVITSLGSVLEQTLESGEQRDDARDILDAARRAQRLTRDLLGFARRGKYRQELLSLNDTVDAVTGLLGHALPKSAELKIALESELWPIVGDPDQLSQVLVNLCINAADALEGSGTITIRTRNLTITKADAIAGFSAGRYALVEVKDDGVGMEAETRERVFEPFFTTKAPGKGTGLGLSMVYGSAQNHGGAVRIDSAPQQGTTVSVYLPAVDPVAPRPTPVEVETSLLVGDRAGQATLLLIDDEPLIRSAGRRLLESFGYRILLAEDGAMGVEVFRAHRELIDLVLLDLMMPVMDGADCFGHLRLLDPDLRVLLITGYADDRVPARLLAEGAVGLVAKPFEPPELARAVSLALSRAQPSQAQEPPGA